MMLLWSHEQIHPLLSVSNCFCTKSIDVRERTTLSQVAKRPRVHYHKKWDTNKKGDITSKEINDVIYFLVLWGTVPIKMDYF